MIKTKRVDNRVATPTLPPLRVRLSFGAGGAVYAVKEAAYTMFVLLFYTQVLGLNGSLTGVIIALSLIWDAISDPLVGTLSDRLHSRWGRRHPFMVASILPMGLGFIGLFSPPEALLDWQAGLGAWLLFWSLWVRTFITTFSIPNLAQATELSSDYQGRSQVLGLRLGALALFSVGVPALALVLIFPTEGGVDGRFDLANYPLYGLLSCLICWVMGTIACVGTRRYARPPATATGLPPVRDSGASLTRDLLRTLKNSSFRNLLAYDIAIMTAFGTVSALNMLVWTYYWQFDTDEISIILSLPSLCAIALALASLKPLGRRFEKYQVLQLAAIGLILNTLWLYPLRMTGLLSADAHGLSFALNFLFMALFLYFFLMRAIHSQSLIADITDEHDWDHGLRQEAGFYAAANFTNKIATTVGPLYGGVALDVIGLEAGMRPGATPQPVLDGLVIAFGLGTIPFLLIALLFALRITLSRARVEDLQRRLRERGTHVRAKEQSADDELSEGEMERRAL